MSVEKKSLWVSFHAVLSLCSFVNTDSTFFVLSVFLPQKLLRGLCTDCRFSSTLCVAPVVEVIGHGCWCSRWLTGLWSDLRSFCSDGSASPHSPLYVCISRSSLTVELYSLFRQPLCAEVTSLPISTNTNHSNYMFSQAAWKELRLIFMDPLWKQSLMFSGLW